MTSSRFKGWTYFFYLSILMFPLLVSQSLANYQPTLSSSGQQNQKFYFFEGFEGLSSKDLLLEDFDLEVIGEVPNGITSESAHSGSNSRFVGPSSCNSFCLDNYSVMTTLTSINLTNDEYAVSYWRRESFDFGGSIQILIDGEEVYNEDGDDGVWNTRKDTGWYRRFFFYNGPINSLTFWEADLTSSNTIYLDDIIIQNATAIDPATMIITERPTETTSFMISPDTTAFIPLLVSFIPLLVLGLVVIAVIVVSVKMFSSRSQHLPKYPPKMAQKQSSRFGSYPEATSRSSSLPPPPSSKAIVQYCSSCGIKLFLEPGDSFCLNCGQSIKF